MKKIAIAVATIIVLSVSAVSQNSNTRIGNDYARAALRAIIYTNQSGITAQRISSLVDEADVEASTPAEEASLKEVNRILANWISRSSYDHQPCYRPSKPTSRRVTARPRKCAGEAFPGEFFAALFGRPHPARP